MKEENCVDEIDWECCMLTMKQLRKRETMEVAIPIDFTAILSPIFKLDLVPYASRSKNPCFICLKCGEEKLIGIFFFSIFIREHEDLMN